MKITKITPFALSVELSLPFGFSQWYYTKKNNLLIKVETDEGIIGFGECYGPSRTAAMAVNDIYAPITTGKDPRAVEHIWNHMWQSSLDNARKGVCMAAISGIDMALWDIRAKAANVPLRTLLGGCGDSVPCYATGMYYRNGMSDNAHIKALLKEAETYVREGFRMIKIKIGKNISFDETIICRFRKEFPGLHIAADANHAYNFKEALRIGRILEENDYIWFEEPVSPENYSDYGKLRDMLTVPIAGGECEQTRFGFSHLCSRNVIDIAQPDIAYAGGITEFQKIATVANANHIDVVPHCWGLRCNQAAAASAITALHENPGRYEKKTVYLEMDKTEHPVRDTVFSACHEVKNGNLIFNSLPGLGVCVDEAKLKNYSVPL